jgi:hypothetical protein
MSEANKIVKEKFNHQISKKKHKNHQLVHTT